MVDWREFRAIALILLVMAGSVSGYALAKAGYGHVTTLFVPEVRLGDRPALLGVTPFGQPAHVPHRIEFPY